MYRDFRIARVTGGLALALLLGASPAGSASPVAGGTEAPPRETLTPVVPPATYGPVLPIIEEDMRRTIERRLRDKLPELKQQLADSLRNHRIPSYPRPTIETTHTVYLDPSLVLSQDLVTPDGKLLGRKGDRVNPLTTIPLTRNYLVINAADERQVAWAAREITRSKRPVTVLLTDGDLAAAKGALAAPVYPAPPALFDRFPIASVPARLGRAKDQLQVDFIGEDRLP